MAKKKKFRCLFENWKTSEDKHTNIYMRDGTEDKLVTGMCDKQCDDCKWAQGRIKRGKEQDIFND